MAVLLLDLSVSVDGCSIHRTYEFQIGLGLARGNQAVDKAVLTTYRMSTGGNRKKPKKFLICVTGGIDLETEIPVVKRSLSSVGNTELEPVTSAV